MEDAGAGGGGSGTGDLAGDEELLGERAVGENGDVIRVG